MQKQGSTTGRYVRAKVTNWNFFDLCRRIHILRSSFCTAGSFELNPCPSFQISTKIPFKCSINITKSTKKWWLSLKPYQMSIYCLGQKHEYRSYLRPPEKPSTPLIDLPRIDRMCGCLKDANRVPSVMRSAAPVAKREVLTNKFLRKTFTT